MAITTKPTTGIGALRDERRAAGLTQQQLAALARCSVSYVALLENGLSPADSAVLPRIMRVLNENGPAGNRSVQKGERGVGDAHREE